MANVFKSHLLQMRGLKHKLYDDKKHGDKSHLLQMRGLKRILVRLVLRLVLVASFTDAWIETEAEAKSILVTMCRIFYRCVD